MTAAQTMINRGMSCVLRRVHERIGKVSFRIDVKSAGAVNQLCRFRATYVHYLPDSADFNRRFCLCSFFSTQCTVCSDGCCVEQREDDVLLYRMITKVTASAPQTGRQQRPSAFPVLRILVLISHPDLHCSPRPRARPHRCDVRRSFLESRGVRAYLKQVDRQRVITCC